MLDPDRIHSRSLKRLVETGDTSGIRADWLPRVQRILSALNIAAAPEELNMPSYGWHRLKGNRSGTFAVTVSRNWRVTYRWDDLGPYDVTLEDYHGS